MNTLVVPLPRTETLLKPRWPATLLAQANRFAQWAASPGPKLEPLADENAHVLAVQALFAIRQKDQ